MTESVPTAGTSARFDDPEVDPSIRSEEIEPDDPADPEEPESTDGDEDLRPGEVGEADAVDVAEQETVIDDEDDGYDRDE
jgi:hypothetical protein